MSAGQRRLRAALALAVAAAWPTACGGHAAEEDGGEQTGTVAGVATASVAEGPLELVVTAIGTVNARPGHYAVLAAPAPTRVADIFVAVGERVAAGDSLVSFERAPFDAAAASAAAALQAAERAYARAVRLVAAGIAPQKDRDQAEADLAQTRAAAVTAERAQRLATLRAPLAGVVTRMDAVLGASVEPSQPLVEVADPTALDVVFNVAPAEAAAIRVGNVAQLGADGAAADSLGRGIVTGVSVAVDTATRAVAVRARIAGARRPLRIGESVVGRIVTAVRPRALTVPVAALVPVDQGFQVFVIDSAGVAHARPVTVGARTAAAAEILAGLAAGETVVTAGAYGVLDGARVGRPKR